MKTRNIFWGLFFILSAGLVIANQLGRFYGLGLPFLILLILMVPIVVKSVRRMNFFGIVFPVAILFAIYNRNVEIWNVSFWAIMTAALFLSIGLSILFGNRWNRFYYHHSYKQHDHGRSYRSSLFGHEHVDAEEASEGMDGEIIRVYESFGECSKYVNSKNLERIEVKASFGSVKIYFTETVLKSNMAEVYLDVNFAGVQLFVPKEWRVEHNVNVTIGGVDEKNRNDTTTDAPVLRLTGGVSFSGVDVIYV